MKYYGKIFIGEKECRFEFENYILTVISETDNFLGWNNLNSVLDNNWLALIDNDNNNLYLKVDGIHYCGKFEYQYNVIGYLIQYSYYDFNLKTMVSEPFSFEHLIIRNDILDYFFRKDKVYIERAAKLLQDWCTGFSENNQLGRPTYQITINQIEYNLDFVVMIEGTNNPFPFNINNAILVSGETSDDIESLWNIIKTMHLFLKFIAQSPSVNFDKEIRIYCGDKINESRTFFYMRPEQERIIYPERVLEYSALESGIKNIIESISSNRIYFRSLFSADANLITYADIMNVCAAFESQYAALYGDFKDEKKSKIKKKMISMITKNKDLFTKEEESYYKDVLEGFRNYRDSLKKRIEHALSEFVEIYGDENIEYDFVKSYLEMPERIKNARNALDHGNKEYILTYDMYWDSELLRAITYMLILKQANIPDEQIRKCLKKISKYAI